MSGFNTYQHLVERGMNPDLYYGMAYDEENDAVTFPLWNLSGQMVGYQIYRPTINDKKINDENLGRYYTYLPRGVDGAFGMDLIDPDSKEPIYCVEGVFKAAVLHRLGYQALALLTSTPKRWKPWFRIMRKTRRLIGIGDPDPAGQKLVNIVGAGSVTPYQDLDEMSDADIIEFVERLKA